MGKGSKTGCRSASHQLFKDKAKNRVDDLHGMFSDLQSARKESRTADVTVFEEQVHQMLREWKAELNEPSPASSLLGNTHVSSELPSETLRLLQLSEEEDDATSKLAGPAPGNAKAEPLDASEPNVEEIQSGGTAVFQEASAFSKTKSSWIIGFVLLDCMHVIMPVRGMLWNLASF